MALQILTGVGRKGSPEQAVPFPQQLHDCFWGPGGLLVHQILKGGRCLGKAVQTGP